MIEHDKVRELLALAAAGALTVGREHRRLCAWPHVFEPSH